MKGQFDSIIQSKLAPTISTLNKAAVDPAFWALTNLNIDLYDNQIEIVQSIVDLSINYLAILQSRGGGKCITGDSLIFTDSGIKQIGEFSTQDGWSPLEINLSTKDGVKSTSHFYKEGLQPTRKILTKSGYELEGTLEHPIYIMDVDGNLKFKKLSELKSGDFVCIQRGQNYWTKTPVKLNFKYEKKSKSNAPEKKFNTPDYVTSDFGRLFGYLIAEGHTASNRFFIFTNADKVLLNDFRYLMTSLFNFNSFSEKESKTNEGAIGIRINSVVLAQFLRYCGIDNSLSAGKSIPWCILQSPKEVMTEFLRAYFEGEASVDSKKGSIEASTASEVLSKQLQIVLSNYGIICSRKPTYKSAINGKNIVRKYYRIVIRNQKNLKLFKDEIGFISNRKQDLLDKCFNRSFNPNNDIVPHQIHKILKVHSKYKSSNAHIPSKGVSLFGETVWNRLHSLSTGETSNASYAVINTLQKEQDFVDINNYTFFYDQIDYIENREAEVYDFAVPDGHNFISNSFVSHNSFAVALGLIKLCIDIPGFRIGLFGPKADQAKRIIKEEIIGRIITPSSKVYSSVDWEHTSSATVVFRNGSSIKALSASETAQQEGEHFHLLVCEESHQISDWVLQERLSPMLGSFSIAKTIKIGIPLYKNHFWQSCNSPSTKYKVLNRNWRDCAIFFNQGSFVYEGKEYPRRIVDLMPRSIKQKLFPNDLSLQYDSVEGYSEVEWNTQYEMVWMDDINLVLSDKHQKLLVSGNFDILEKGRPEMTEKYYFGLDTASGSILPGKKDLDFTWLSIWRKTQDNVKQCFSADTKIKLLDGSIKTIKEISELPTLDNIWVYSINETQDIVPGKVTKAWKTGTRETLRITLDNNESFECTLDHQIMLRDGSYKEANLLDVGNSLMPFYSQLSVKNKLKKQLTGYELIYNPRTCTWEYMHKIVAENVHGNASWPNVVHHKNFIKIDNSPTNLLVIPFKDHIKLHYELSVAPERRKKSSDTMKKNWAAFSPEERKEQIALMQEGLQEYYKSDQAKINQKKNLQRAFEVLAKLTPEEISVIHGKGKSFEERYGIVRAKELKAKISNGHLGITHTEEYKENSSKIATEQNYFEHFLVNNNWKDSLKKRSKYIKIIEQYSQEELTDLLRNKTVKELKLLWGCGANVIWKLRRIFNCNKRVTTIPLPDNFLWKNHKIISIEKSVVQDVYDLTVNKYHNFALNSGIFVHNCVAQFAWQGDVVQQIEEIKELIHPDHGVFQCEFGLADYSNIAIGIVESFKKDKIPIEGIMFNGTEPVTHKNYKNAMVDQFVFELESERVQYPALDKVESDKLFKEAYFQWCSMERQKKTGINDIINVPTAIGHDDAASSNILAIFAADRSQNYAGNFPKSMKSIPLPSAGLSNLSGKSIPMPGFDDPSAGKGKYLKDRM